VLLLLGDGVSTNHRCRAGGEGLWWLLLRPVEVAGRCRDFRETGEDGSGCSGGSSALSNSGNVIYLSSGIFQTMRQFLHGQATCAPLRSPLFSDSHRTGIACREDV
jgi:hypothetical protein